MGVGARIVGTLFFVIVGSAVLTPWVYWAGHAFSETIPFLATVPLRRYFHRVILVLALVALPSLLKRIGVRSREDMGLIPNPRWRRDLFLGFGFSVSMVLLMVIGLVAFEAVKLNSSFRFIKLLEALATGCAVALIEEYFFRGALFGALRRNMKSVWWALFVLTAFFAILHFIKPHPGKSAVTEVNWSSGFVLLRYAFHQFTDPWLIAEGLVTLCLFGWMLGHTVIVTKSLWMSIGLHAGFVFALRSFKFHSSTSVSRHILGPQYLTGFLPVFLLFMSYALILMYFYLSGPKRKNSSETLHV